jgi:serine protease Do
MTTDVGDALAALARDLARSTVHVHDGRRGSGSGIVWGDGLIVTNAHVASGAHPWIESAAGRARGTLIARDPERDLAAIALDPRAPDVHALGVVPARVRDSASLRCGEIVLAFGHPLGLRGALSAGIVQRAGERFVVSDVSLAPGNSGGPLVDAQGRVAGVNSMVAGRLALSIPSEAVRVFLSRAGSRRRRAA